ncbi:MAG: hypothetical protein R2688_01865 [Fimbriimonadaceae bacterium]
MIEHQAAIDAEHDGDRIESLADGALHRLDRGGGFKNWRAHDRAIRVDGSTDHRLVRIDDWRGSKLGFVGICHVLLSP